MQGDLDQLWYTWSTNGLDAMAMGYRVRAASGELRDTQSMRYRVLDRFLRYEPPQGININEFDARIAPISYAFLKNGAEHLLVRKVFKGRDLAGRNSVYFTHLIAGLPAEFTVRDAIRLWDCTEIWAESEEQKAAHDTSLDPLPYQMLKRYADQGRPALSLPFAAIRQQLEDLLLNILGRQGLPQKVTLVGRSQLAAALIYSVTHCLPLTLLGNFSFSTYESLPDESEATMVTTVTGTELADSTFLEVHAGDAPAVSPADLQRYKSYVAVALNYLVSGKIDEFLSFIRRTEAHHCQTTDQLIEEFNLAFSKGPLTVRQIETIVTHADEYTEKLRDATFQTQSATLLLEQRPYWRQQGYKTFGKIAGQLVLTNTRQSDPTRQDLTIYFNGMATSILTALREGLLQVKTLEAQGQDAWTIPQHYGSILTTLFPPVSNEQFWLKLLSEFAQPSLLAYLKSDALWHFQLWLLEQARQLPQPQLLLPQMQPWLEIPSWEKLEKVFALKLPSEWTYTAIYGRIQDVPRGALPLVQKHEPLFTAALQQLLRQGGQANINAASAFFQKMVEYGLPQRVPLLLALVNTYYEAGFVQTIFACVSLVTPSRLQASEINAVLTGCRSEVIATCNRAQALADYLQECILSLTPARLAADGTTRLLKQIDQLGAGPGLPPLLPTETANLVSHWLMVSTFIGTSTLDRHLLTKTETAIRHILRSKNPVLGASLVQTFAEEFIPILVQQASSESDLEMIQDILGTTLTSTRWDLLRWMALLIGQNRTPLHKLIPYTLCGIREAERFQRSPDELDTYLRSLFGRQDREMLKNVDTAMNCDIWPDLVKQKWEIWRGRGKKGFSIPSLRSGTGRLQAEQSALRLPGPESYAPAHPKEREQVNYTLTAAESSAAQADRIIATLPALNRSISHEEYTGLHQIMPSLLSYWLRERLVEHKDNSKLLNWEIKTLKQIHRDLQTSPTQASRNLVIYLADDIVIAETVKSRIAPGTQLAHTLNPERYLTTEFTNLLAFLQGKTIHEALYKNGLRILIRRYMVIDQFDSQKNSLKDVFGKNGLQDFLEKERAEVHFT